MLNDAAWRRLTHYSRRAADGPAEYVHRSDAMRLRGGREVRYVNQRLRAIVWADQEVRDALLDAEFEQLAAGLKERDCRRALDLLDLVSAMSLQAEQHPRSTP